MEDVERRQGFYSRLEDSWYSLLDSLEGRGVPVHVVVDALETRGVPSLPAFLSLASLLLLVAVAIAFSSFSASQGLQVNVFAGGEPVEGATVRVWGDGELLAEERTGPSGELSFALQGDFVIETIKPGFPSVNRSVRGNKATVVLSTERLAISLPLKNPDVESVSEREWRKAGGANSESSTGKVVAYVSGSDGSKPDNAKVSFYYSNGVLATEGEGNAFTAELPVDSEVFVMVEAAGYLPYDGSQDKKALTPAGAEFSVVLKAIESVGELSSGACADGERIDCITSDNCVGVQDCSGAEFSDCAKVEPASCGGPCFEGESVECRTSDNCVGSMACTAEGYYAECVKEEPFKCFTPEGSQSYSKTVVRAVDEEGRELSASISVFVEGSEAPLLKNKESGEELALDSGKEYYAVAYKPGYYPEHPSFSAGGTIEIVLRPAEDPASLRALVTDEFDGSDVNGASVSLFYVDAGKPRLIAGPETARNGLAVFEGLEKGRIVSVRAAYEGRQGEGGTLLGDENELQVVLELNDAELFVSAIDLETGNPVQQAAFTARQENQTVDSCTGAGCPLKVKARVPFELETAANGFVPALDELALPVGESDFEVRLLSEESAGDVSATLRGVKAWNGLDADSLKLGHYYEAHFQLVTRDADYSGFYLRLGEGLEIVNYSPPAALEELGGESVHLTYSGEVNRVIKVGFVVDDELELDEETRSAQALLEWRAFAERGDLTLRYPVYSEECAEPCIEAPVKNRTYLVYSPSTSCENGYCVSVTLRQGSRESGAGAFDAYSMAGFGEGDAEFEPLVADWKVEFFSEPGEQNAFWLVAPQGHLEALEANNPIGESSGGYRVCGEGAFYGVSGNEVGIDLTGLQECSDYRVYGDYYSEPYSVGGTALFKPSEPSQAVLELEAQFTDGERVSRHYSPFRVTDQGFEATDYGVVSVSLHQEDLNGTPVKQNSTNYFEAYEVFDCLDDDGTFNDACPHSLVSAETEFSAKRNRGENHVSLSVDGQKIKVIIADCGDYAVHAGDTGFSFDAGALRAGESIRCSALLAPLATGYASVSAKLSVVDESGSHDTQVNRKVYVNSLDEKGGADLDQPGFGEDCGPSPKIYFDSTLSTDRLHTADGCNQISFKYSPVFPADAVKIGGVGERPFISTRIISGDEGLAGCFESCDEYGSNCVPGFDALVSEGNQTLKFNSLSGSCPPRFQPYGSGAGMDSAQATLQLWLPGECEADDEGCGTELVVSVEPYDADSLFIGPVFTSFQVEGESQEVFYPQLWTITNHRQFGEREFLFVEDVEGGEGLTPYFKIEFDGPGQKTFAYHPQPGKTLSVYEASHPEKPRLITFYEDAEVTTQFDSDGGEYPVYADPALYEGRAVVQGLNEYALLSGPEEYCVEIDGERECTGEGFEDEISYTNIPFDPDRAKALIKKARFTAERTSFWRSGTGESWCTNDCVDGGEVDASCISDWEKCKPSLEDWRLYENVQYYDYHPCTFCNNTYHPGAECGEDSEYLSCTYNEIDAFDCDQRCDSKTQSMLVEYGEGSCETLYLGDSRIPEYDATLCYEAEACPLLFDGEAPACFDDDGDGFLQGDEYASIEASVLVGGDSPYYECTAGKTLAVQPGCRVYCDNSCFNEYECDLLCNDEGLVPEETDFERVQTGWLDGAKGVCRESGGGTDELPCIQQAFFEGEGTLEPASSFPEYGAQTFSYHFPLNTINKEEQDEEGEYVYWHDSLYGEPCNEDECTEGEALRINRVEGCSLQDDVIHEAWNEQALYGVEVLNEPDVFTGEALWTGTARALTLSSDNYVGVQCRKPKDVWGETELCGPIWNDYSDTYGACINSLYQFEEEHELYTADFAGRSSGLLTLSKDDRYENEVWQGDENDYDVPMNQYVVTPEGFIAYGVAQGRVDQDFLTRDGYWNEMAYWKPDGRYGESKTIQWVTPFVESGWFTAILAAATIATLPAAGGSGSFLATIFGVEGFGATVLTWLSATGTVGTAVGSGLTVGQLIWAAAEKTECTSGEPPTDASGNSLGEGAEYWEVPEADFKFKACKVGIQVIGEDE